MKLTNWVLTILILSGIYTSIHSFPRFALKWNDNCAKCHVNPTGGTMRNENGWYYGMFPMSLISPRDTALTLSPKLNDNISFGIDFRGQYLYSEEYGRTDFQNMAGAMYADIKLSSKIEVASRYDFAQQIWEAYGLLKILPANGYIKGGTFTPNFGVRIDDHTAYTRGGDFGVISSTGKQGLPYTPFYTESGFEVGAYVDEWAFITASVGKPNNAQFFESDPTYTARVEFSPAIDRVGFLLGGSYAAHKTKLFPPPNFAETILATNLYGGFFGIGYDKFSLLAEYDIADDYQGRNIKSAAVMAEFTYLITVGLDALVRYDRWDPNSDVENDELSRIIVGLEFFPYSFIEVKTQYRFQMEDPEVNNNALVMQIHFWY
jgi:hypothetical protein